MAKVDLRKLKDQATRAVEKRQYAKAAELYEQIAGGEPHDPDWLQRAGEAWRKVPDAARAIAQLTLAAEGYAHEGFLLKAIAVCKVVLQLDPKHTATQGMLAGLYAKREGRTASGAIKVVSPAPAADALPPATMPETRTPPPPMPIALSDNAEPALGIVAAAPVVALDERPAAAPPTTAPGPAPPAAAPLEVLPLHRVLGGKKSAQFSVVDLAAVAGDSVEPSAYEISLDEELSLADAIPVELEAPPAAPSSSPSSPERLPTIADETDFGDLLADAPPPPRPRTPTRELPRIPLLSSLSADELRTLIERVDVRDCAAGDVVMRQGAAGGSLFVVVRGRVQVIAEQPARRELATLGEGAFFGELALLTNFPRSATVIAAAPTQLLEISRELVGEIVQRSPEVLKTLLRFFRDRLLDRLLGASPLFSSFAPDEARALAERFVFLELEPGMRVIAEGERAPGLFLLLCGEARVMRAGAERARLAPGDVFGEMSLLTRGPASATIETRTKCWALELPRERFQEIMLTYPQMLEYVSELAERRTQANVAGSEESVDFF